MLIWRQCCMGNLIRFRIFFQIFSNYNSTRDDDGFPKWCSPYAKTSKTWPLLVTEGERSFLYWDAQLVGLLLHQLKFVSPTFMRFSGFLALKQWCLTLAMQNCHICFVVITFRHWSSCFSLSLAEPIVNKSFCPTNFFWKAPPMPWRPRCWPEWKSDWVKKWTEKWSPNTVKRIAAKFKLPVGTYVYFLIMK